MYREPIDSTSKEKEDLLRLWGFEGGSDVYVVEDFFPTRQASYSLFYDDGLMHFVKFPLNGNSYIATNVKTHLKTCSTDELRNRTWYIEAIQHSETLEANFVRILIPSIDRPLLYSMYYWQHVIPDNPNSASPLTWR